jgi:steroid 5-alpha reductase family enzyme
VVGWFIWCSSWCFENAADIQKLKFLAECQKKGKAELNTACLGHPPFSGPSYKVWTFCRHPNYFGEWGCWLGLVVAACSSLHSVTVSLESPKSASSENITFWGLAVMLFYTLRMFYDCLVHWTGAGPAEHYSVQKRVVYREYQQSTRCFWPAFLPLPNWIPGIDHHQVAGWPSA